MGFPRTQHFFLCLALFSLFWGVSEMAWGAVCTVSPLPVPFGTYDPFSSTQITATGKIDISCDETGVAFQIKLDSGENTVGFQPRRMKSIEGGSIDYNLYRDLPHTEIWGNGAPPTVIQQGTSNPQSHSSFILYGTIPVGQNIAPGSYADTVRITVEW